MSSRPSVFVIIVTYNGALWIRQCLESLRSSTYPCIPIVVDNASSDGTQRIVQDEFPEALLLEEKMNLGFGVANNIGINKALELAADYVFLLNQDAYILDNTIEELIDALEINKDYLLATPIHCSPDTSRIDPTTQIAYLQKYCPNFISDACLRQIKDFYPIKGINAAAWLISREAIFKVGGFDPLFFMYGEDDDLINRYSYHGLQFLLVTKSLIVHLRGKSPQLNNTWLQSVKKSGARIRSSLLANVKNPSNNSSALNILILICNGALRPTIDFLVERNISTLIAHYYAFFSTLSDFRIASRNAEACKTEGPHFISQKKHFYAKSCKEGDKSHGNE